MGSSFSVMNDTNEDVYATYTADGSEVSLELGFTSYCSGHLGGESNGTWGGYTTSGNWTNNEFGDQVINMTVSGFASQDDANSFYINNVKNNMEAGVNLYSPPSGTLHSAGNLSLSLPQHFWGVKISVTSSTISFERGYLAVTSGSTDKSNNSYNMSSAHWSYSSR